MYCVKKKVIVCKTKIKGNEVGKEKEDTVQFTFRIPVGLKAELERYATFEDRSLAKQIIWALRRYVDERAKDVPQ